MLVLHWDVVTVSFILWLMIFVFLFSIHNLNISLKVKCLDVMHVLNNSAFIVFEGGVCCRRQNRAGTQ